MTDHCKIEGYHCEQCGRPAEGEYEPREGYTTCCNELANWADQCRNFHAERAS